MVEIGSVVLEKRILKYFQYNFIISIFSSLGERHGPSFEQTWITSMLCAKFGWNGTVALNVVNAFLLFCYYLPIVNGVALHLQQIESPLPKDALCQVWLKLVLWFCRRFLNVVNVFLLFHYYLPMEKGMAFHSNKLDFPLPKDALCQVWLKLA